MWGDRSPRRLPPSLSPAPLAPAHPTLHALLGAASHHRQHACCSLVCLAADMDASASSSSRRGRVFSLSPSLPLSLSVTLSSCPTSDQSSSISRSLSCAPHSIQAGSVVCSCDRFCSTLHCSSSSQCPSPEHLLPTCPTRAAVHKSDRHWHCVAMRADVLLSVASGRGRRVLCVARLDGRRVGLGQV
jgi:hypothetical protein